jgi:hypothetical protein
MPLKLLANLASAYRPFEFSKLTIQMTNIIASPSEGVPTTIPV